MPSQKAVGRGSARRPRNGEVLPEKESYLIIANLAEMNPECPNSLRLMTITLLQSRYASVSWQRDCQYFFAVAELRFSEFLNLIRSEPGSDFAQDKPVGQHVDHSEISDDGVNAFDRCERIGALFHNFWRAVFRIVLPRHNQSFRSDRNIHCPTNISRTPRARHAPVCEIAILCHLQSSKN